MFLSISRYVDVLKISLSEAMVMYRPEHAPPLPLEHPKDRPEVSGIELAADMNGPTIPNALIDD